MLTVAGHKKETVTECIEGSAEDSAVQIAVLAIGIDFTVGDECACQKQLVSCMVTQGMHGLALLTAVFLQLVTFVCNDEVGIEFQQFRLKDSGTLIIHDHDFQTIGLADFGKLLPFLCGCTFQNRQRIWESSEFFKLLFPHTEDGQRCNNKDAVDPAKLIKDAGDSDGSDRLSGTHFHEQSHAVASKIRREKAEPHAGKIKSLLLMVIRLDRNRHRKGSIRHRPHLLASHEFQCFLHLCRE